MQYEDDFFDDDYYDDFAASPTTPSGDTEEFGGEDYNTDDEPEQEPPDEGARDDDARAASDAALDSACAAVSAILDAEGSVSLDALKLISDSNETRPPDVAFRLNLQADADNPSVLRRASAAQPASNPETSPNASPPAQQQEGAPVQENNNASPDYGAAADYVYSVLLAAEDHRCRVDDVKDKVCALIGKERLRETALLKVLSLRPALEYDSSCKQPKLHTAKWLRIIPGALVDEPEPTASEVAEGAEVAEVAEPEHLRLTPELLNEAAKRVQEDMQAAWDASGAGLREAETETEPDTTVVDALECEDYDPQLTAEEPISCDVASTPRGMNHGALLATAPMNADQAYCFATQMLAELMRPGVGGDIHVDYFAGTQRMRVGVSNNSRDSF